ncbi:hypothetical protein CF8_0138 [Aeromonas phage CF8]|nr:hypothetical protein CF8_0138 [Aeromonas phage CF8]
MSSQLPCVFDQNRILHPVTSGMLGSPITVDITITEDPMTGRTGTVSWAGSVQGFLHLAVDSNAVIGFTPVNEDPVVLASLVNIVNGL